MVRNQFGARAGTAAVVRAQLDRISALATTAFSYALHNAVAAGGNAPADEVHETVACLIETAALGAALARASLLHLERELSRASSRVAPLVLAQGGAPAPGLDPLALQRTAQAMLAEVARLRSGPAADLERLSALNDRFHALFARFGR